LVYYIILSILAVIVLVWCITDLTKFNKGTYTPSRQEMKSNLYLGIVLFGFVLVYSIFNIFNVIVR
jgi:hypothetical protein